MGLAYKLRTPTPQRYSNENNLSCWNIHLFRVVCCPVLQLNVTFTVLNTKQVKSQETIKKSIKECRLNNNEVQINYIVLEIIRSTELICTISLAWQRALTAGALATGFRRRENTAGNKAVANVKSGKLLRATGKLLGRMKVGKLPKDKRATVFFLFLNRPISVHNSLSISSNSNSFPQLLKFIHVHWL